MDAIISYFNFRKRRKENEGYDLPNDTYHNLKYQHFKAYSMS
jgi:hypothetical protein